MPPWCSESYGEGEGDYEEYYDEDVSYNSGDPASAGKGRRSQLRLLFIPTVEVHWTKKIRYLISGRGI